MSKEQKRYEQFVKEIETISLKYGVSLNCCGGVNIVTEDDLNDLESVNYDCDYTSGDLNSEEIWKKDK